MHIIFSSSWNVLQTDRIFCRRVSLNRSKSYAFSDSGGGKLKGKAKDTVATVKREHTSWPRVQARQSSIRDSDSGSAATKSRSVSATDETLAEERKTS